MKLHGVRMMKALEGNVTQSPRRQIGVAGNGAQIAPAMELMADSFYAPGLVAGDGYGKHRHRSQGHRRRAKQHTLWLHIKFLIGLLPLGHQPQVPAGFPRWLRTRPLIPARLSTFLLAGNPFQRRTICQSDAGQTADDTISTCSALLPMRAPHTRTEQK